MYGKPLHPVGLAVGAGTAYTLPATLSATMSAPSAATSRMAMAMSDTTDRDLILALVAAQDEVEEADRKLRCAERTGMTKAGCARHVAVVRLQAARAAVTRRGHALMKEAKGE